MMKDAVATMGGLLPDETSGRDAVHVAVFSAFAAVKLYPGQDIAVIHQGDIDIEVAPLGTAIAIVDPFLKVAVQPGERFWAYLYPRTITALSHRWSHPALEEVKSVYSPPAAKLGSELWLTNFCHSYNNEDYNFDMMAILKNIFDGHYDDDEYLTILGRDESGPIPTEVWHHASIVFGKPVPAQHPTYFSCSC